MSIQSAIGELRTRTTNELDNTFCPLRLFPPLALAFILKSQGCITPSCDIASALLFAVDRFVFTNRPEPCQNTEHYGEPTASDNDSATYLV